LTSAVTIARIDCQNALAELVGWTGWRGMAWLMPFTGSDMYLPAVLKDTLLAPRLAPTLMVIFAWFAIGPSMGDCGAPRPCGVTRPGGRVCGAPHAAGSRTMNPRPAVCLI